MNLAARIRILCLTAALSCCVLQCLGAEKAVPEPPLEDETKTDEDEEAGRQA